MWRDTSSEVELVSVGAGVPRTVTEMGTPSVGGDTRTPPSGAADGSAPAVGDALANAVMKPTPRVTRRIICSSLPPARTSTSYECALSPRRSFIRGAVSHSAAVSHSSTSHAAVSHSATFFAAQCPSPLTWAKVRACAVNQDHSSSTPSSLPGSYAPISAADNSVRVMSSSPSVSASARS